MKREIWMVLIGAALGATVAVALMLTTGRYIRVETIEGTMIYAAVDVSKTLCIQTGATEDDVDCTGWALPPDAELPPSGTRVEAGKVWVPLPQADSAASQYIYVVPDE